MRASTASTRRALRRAVPRSNDNAQGEYYLTDVLESAATTAARCLALTTDDAEEAMGVNSRIQLAQAAKAMQRRINQRHMAAGVTMWDPDTVWIGPDDGNRKRRGASAHYVSSGQDFRGQRQRDRAEYASDRTRRSAAAAAWTRRSPKAPVSTIAPRRVRARTCAPARICAKARRRAPMWKSRSPRSARAARCRIFPYIGDTTMGLGRNIGAGSITCNYDGVNKNATGDRRRRVRRKRFHARGP